MKKLFTILASVIFVANVFAQSPQSMSYQAVVRNSSNTLVINTQVGMRISILKGSNSGPSVYLETQTPTTNANGLASFAVGSGVVVSGIFANINWASGSYFIKTETDPTGGTNYTITGTSQLLSVPYALYALSSGGIAGSNLSPKIIYGSENSGTGYTASSSAGTTTITFNTPFASPPTVTATLMNAYATAGIPYIEIQSISNTSVTFIMYRMTGFGGGQQTTNYSFNFIAVGN